MGQCSVTLNRVNFPTVFLLFRAEGPQKDKSERGHSTPARTFAAKLTAKRGLAGRGARGGDVAHSREGPTTLGSGNSRPWMKVLVTPTPTSNTLHTHTRTHKHLDGYRGLRVSLPHCENLLLLIIPQWVARAVCERGINIYRSFCSRKIHIKSLNAFVNVIKVKSFYCENNCKKLTGYIATKTGRSARHKCTSRQLPIPTKG